MISYLVTSLLVGLAIAKIPADVQFCGRKNPNLGDCMKETAHNLIPQMIDGVPEWDIPDIEPLHLDKIDVANDRTFTAKLNKVKVYGLSKLQIVSTEADLDAETINANVSLPSLRVEGEYDGVTRILVTLVGKGPITVVTDKIAAKLHLSLKYVERNGVKYMYLSAVNLKLDVRDFTAKYQSYDNPGGTLDEAINTALNGDTAQLLKYLTETLQIQIGGLILEIGNKFLRHFTFDQLFPDHA